MREKIRRWVEAVRAMPYWYQGAVGFLGLSLCLTVIALALSLFGINLFLLSVDDGMLSFEAWAVENDMAPFLHGLVMAIGGTLCVVLSSQRYDFDGVLKAGLLIILPCISLQFVTGYAAFAVISTGYLIILAWVLNPGWKTLARILAISAATALLQAMMSYIKMPNYPLMTQHMISYGIIFNLDIWQLMLAVIMIDFAILIKRKEV